MSIYQLCQTYWGSHGCQLERNHDVKGHSCECGTDIDADGRDPSGFVWDLYGEDVPGSEIADEATDYLEEVAPLPEVVSPYGIRLTAPHVGDGPAEEARRRYIADLPDASIRLEGTLEGD